MPEPKLPPEVSPEELRALMQAMGCQTQHEFAQRLGVTQPRVSQMLSGAHPIKPGTLLTLVREYQARYLGPPDPAPPPV